MSTVTQSPVVPPFAAAPEAVLATLGSDEQGLSSADAARRLADVGPNRLPDAPRRHPLLRFAAHFDDVLIYILLAAAVLKAILVEWVDFAVILVVAVVSALVGYVQEGRAASALAGIATMLSVDAQALRDGAWQHVDAQSVVPGDVVRVRSGDRVPADLRLLEAVTLQVDEAALTGESLPAAKEVAAVAADAGVGDRTSMLFSGTIVTAGRGVAVVTATGAGTEIGRIQALVTGAGGHLETPLTRQLARLGKQLSLTILGMAAVMLVIGRLVHAFALDELVSAAIGFAVAAVPEGLPALVTITLALGVQQMARRNAITRRLTAVEGLGSVTTICSDKTGTLTRNEMTATTVVTGDATYSVEGLGYEPVGRVVPNAAPTTHGEHDDLDAMMLAFLACADARLVESDGHWTVVGQPTEGALVALARKAGGDASDVRRLAQVPFESSNKFSATLDEAAGVRAVHVVGAPDRLLERSTTELRGGVVGPLDRAAWESVVDDLGGHGLRVLAAARRPAPDEQALGLAEIGEELELLGVVGIVDPPRPEAVQAIADCHAAGIHVTMITGDHAGTAEAIARELGIVGPDGTRVVTGAELEAMTQDELRRHVEEVAVFARTSPEHKIRIIRALQSHGQVVAMTGDGVNDAPALTRADVGIAMGIKGTAATKEAADIVLADDNFATIERAVEEGRRIYDNIRKSVIFLLPTNGAQSLVILVAVLAGLALPLAPVQILWVNLVTAVTLSLALAGEPAEPGIMSRPPRPAGSHVVTPRVLALIAVTSLLIGGATLAVYLLDRRLHPGAGTAQTAAVTVLAVAQMTYLFSCRFLGSSSLTPRVLRGNRLVWVACGALVVLQLVFVYAPFMHSWFSSTSLGLGDWALAVAAAVVVLLLTEAAKAVIRGTQRPAGAM